MTDPDVTPLETPTHARPRRSPLRRLGCGLALVIWFLIVLSPCAIFILATQGEIRITTGGAPNQFTRLWLMSEPEASGFGLSRASLHPRSEGVECVQTDVRYYLWAGEGQDVTYCDCYEHPAPESDWTYVDTIEGQCPAE